MKILTSIIAASAVALTAGVASAQQNVSVSGEAERSCTLPSAWTFVSGFNGAGGSQWSAGTWTIPEAAFADNSSNAVAAGEYAIRVRGTGFCNASHSIRLQSSRGGLRSGDVTQAVPAGFANGRALKYEAYWSGGSGGAASAFGPQTVLNAQTPGQASPSTPYTVSASLAPPGNRTFDVRIGMARGALAQPLLGGTYSDTVTVTIALAP